MEINQFPKVKAAIDHMVVAAEENMKDGLLEEVYAWMIEEFHKDLFNKAEVFLTTLSTVEFQKFCHWENIDCDNEDFNMQCVSTSRFLDNVYYYLDTHCG